MASTSDIRNGLCIDWEKDTWSVVEFQHVKPARGAAFVRTKLKSMTNGKIVDNTFSAGAKIDEVRVERRKFQYLYEEDAGFNFMDIVDFDQIVLDKKLINRPDLLKADMEVDILYHAAKNQLLTLEMPQTVIMKITYTEPGLKGDTATNAFKPATVETGAEVRVPLFINEGDLIKIDTQTGAYMERIKQ